jgi:DNA-directed RNA polymerase subunit beta
MATPERKLFTRFKEPPVGDLLAHQRASWSEFVTDEISAILSEFNPINDTTGQKLSLSFGGYEFRDPIHDDAEAKKRLANYEAPLYVECELTNKTTGEVKKQEIFFGYFPWMTDRASFVINGTERVVVSQLVRSSGVFFASDAAAHKNLYNAKLIPTRGSWIEWETAANDAVYIKIDRKKRLPMTTFMRAIGYTTDTEIREAFGTDEEMSKFLEATLAADKTKSANEALMAVFQNIRPGEQASPNDAKIAIERLFFDPRRYDYGKVGRYKINQRMGLDVANTVDNRVLSREDFVAITKEVIRLNVEQGEIDDIDSLSNRRVRLIGELMARQFRVGLARLQRNIVDRMGIVDPSTATPASLLNTRPMVMAMREFFTSSQLSQLMDETNPLAELSHKRRLSSMGPGGLTRERAGLEVRDAHPTHYGRICTVETPEGGNVGLVLNLAIYARVNEYGFIETPYYKVVNGKVTDEIVYLTADKEQTAIIADSSAELTKDGKFASDRVSARINMAPTTIEVNRVDYIDFSRKQILGASAAMIPFVEHNRVDRALTGSSMQKQAVPLIKTEAPTIGTGVESALARNTSQVTLAEADGEVVKASAEFVEVKYGKETKKYTLVHFTKNNDDRCINQKVAVLSGQKVKKGDVLINGASVADGELSLGRNLLIAFMPWHGFNMDDAVIISDRLVREDVMTSINIKDYIVDVRETKLGPEQITRDIPNAPEYTLRHLDESGIAQIGSEIKDGDVLVGKITPKGEQELSSEERLLRAIFGDKAKDVRDTSVRAHGINKGKVIGVQILDKSNATLKSDVLEQVQIFIAETRKIEIGDKMAGRYGNKGVVSRIVPAEDMPFMEDGTPIDVLLNPMGVPSRMNLGQLFEVPLGLAGRKLGYNVAAPAFDGPSSETISEELEKAGLPRDGKVQLFDGQTGEAFDGKTAVGVMYMLKLHHMVSDKIHARSTGPYTMVTQQPLGGKAQNGGQRFGEMEVWALEAYGASAILQEMLTIKSDDVVGRAKAYEAIIKNDPILGPKLPEGFNVLTRELRGLGLNIEMLKNGEALSIGEYNSLGEAPRKPRTVDNIEIEIKNTFADLETSVEGQREDAEAEDTEIAESDEEDTGVDTDNEELSEEEEL